MNCKNLLPLVALFLLFSCHSDKTEPKKEYTIDIQSSTDSLMLFGEHIISTPLYERDLAIHPQGDEIIYTLGDYKQSKRALVVLKKTNDVWGNPEIINISGQYQDIEPFYTNDGNRLYFASNRPIYNDTSRSDYNIWFSDKTGDQWSEPKALDSIINTKGDEFFPSLSENGNLYFTATRANGIGREDIFRAEFVDNTFKSPEPLPTEINSVVFEFNAYISPKEDCIIFSSFGRKDGFGGGDLYISTKDSSGNWSPSKNLGPLINSKKLDFCPFVDWNHQNFYFSSERTIPNNRELKTIDDIKQTANATVNGFGNIYKISLNKITATN